jgi:hypothetical protein
MAKSAKVISIPKPPQDAFNKHRPVSDLLWTQVEHLAAVVKRDIDDERRAINTEGQASDFIKKMTAILNPQGARKTQGLQQNPSSGSVGKKQPRSPKR